MSPGTRRERKSSRRLHRPASLCVAYDFESLRKENTVRGQFVDDVLRAELPEEDRRAVLVTGLRALESRSDLDVA